MGKIALCADIDSLMHPEFMGLEGLNIEGLDWLETFSDAACARTQVSQQELDWAWVVSANDMAGVNVAAALRADKKDMPIYLVASEPSGSELSRAKAADVTRVLDTIQFRVAFESERRRRSLVDQLEPPDIDEPLSCAEKPSQSDAPAAFVLTLFGGSGGCGKSTVAALAAYAAAAKGYRTVAVDCDLQFGDLREIMPAAKAASIDDVLAEDECMRALSAETEAGLPALVCAPSRLERSEELARHLPELLGKCSESFDLVIANTGSNWTECHAQLLEKSSCAIFLIDQRASSVRACKHALELCIRLGIATGSFEFALNRCGKGALFTPMDISNVMDGARVFGLKDGGSEVEELLGAGMATELVSGKSELCASVEAMLDEVLPVGSAVLAKRSPVQAGSASEETITFDGGGIARFVMPEARTKRRGRHKRAGKAQKSALSETAGDANLKDSKGDSAPALSGSFPIDSLVIK